MLNPSEQKKGGFGAFAERERDRKDVRAESNAPAGPAAPESIAPSADASAAPRRRRFFGFILP